MKRFWLFLIAVLLSGCTSKYILMDEDGYSVNASKENRKEFYQDNYVVSDRAISADDVFVVEEGDDFVTYQYRNILVNEVSPLASLYCDDVAHGKSPYLREVNMYHNGFMRATFDCVDLAI